MTLFAIRSYHLKIQPYNSLYVDWRVHSLVSLIQTQLQDRWLESPQFRQSKPELITRSTAGWRVHSLVSLIQTQLQDLGWRVRSLVSLSQNQLQDQAGWRVHSLVSLNQNQLQDQAGWRVHSLVSLSQNQLQDHVGWRVNSLVSLSQNQSQDRWLESPQFGQSNADSVSYKISHSSFPFSRQLSLTE